MEYPYNPVRREKQKNTLKKMYAKMTKEERSKRFGYWKGKKLSKEHIEKSRLGLIGYKRSEEHQEKLNKARWKGGVQATRERIKNNLKYRLNSRMRKGIRRNLANGKNGKHWFELVNYDVNQLKKHLSKTMPIGYNWSHFLKGELHIDHIIPVKYFNFSQPYHLDFKRCWELKNLQLLTKSDNSKKSAKLIKPLQLTLKV